jgi:hypothetical protein
MDFERIACDIRDLTREYAYRDQPCDNIETKMTIINYTFVDIKWELSRKLTKLCGGCCERESTEKRSRKKGNWSLSLEGRRGGWIEAEES